MRLSVLRISSRWVRPISESSCWFTGRSLSGSARHYPQSVLKHNAKIYATFGREGNYGANIRRPVVGIEKMQRRLGRARSASVAPLRGMTAARLRQTMVCAPVCRWSIVSAPIGSTRSATAGKSRRLSACPFGELRNLDVLGAERQAGRLAGQSRAAEFRSAREAAARCCRRRFR